MSQTPEIDWCSNSRYTPAQAHRLTAFIGRGVNYESSLSIADCITNFSSSGIRGQGPGQLPAEGAHPAAELGFPQPSL
jgi:hypothetical protein